MEGTCGSILTAPPYVGSTGPVGGYAVKTPSGSLDPLPTSTADPPHSHPQVRGGVETVVLILRPMVTGAYRRGSTEVFWVNKCGSVGQKDKAGWPSYLIIGGDGIGDSGASSFGRHSHQMWPPF